MAKLTLLIDDDLLRRARIRALEQGTSVNSLVRDYLSHLAGESPARRAVLRFLALTDEATGDSGGGRRQWHRDDVHAR